MPGCPPSLYKCRLRRRRQNSLKLSVLRIIQPFRSARSLPFAHPPRITLFAWLSPLKLVRCSRPADAATKQTVDRFRGRRSFLECSSRCSISKACVPAARTRQEKRRCFQPGLCIHLHVGGQAETMASCSSWSRRMPCPLPKDRNASQQAVYSHDILQSAARVILVLLLFLFIFLLLLDFFEVFELLLFLVCLDGLAGAVFSIL